MTDPDDTLHFSPETADYAAEVSLRRYPVTLTADGIDAHASARAAYVQGLSDGLAIATP